MSVVNGRMAARTRAAAAQKEWRLRQAETVKRRQAWAVEAAIAIGERDDVIARCDRVAGQAFAKLVADGLSLEDAVAWTGAAITVKEARALIAGAERYEAQESRDAGDDNDT